MNKVIKNEKEYEGTMVELESLLDRDPAPGTPDNERLELLTLLVKDYESRSFQFVPPDPVEAIKFRMEQQNLTPRDLIPFMGSRSKVSEVLSGKRPLTISMMRALNSGLKIPASILIQEKEPENCNDAIDWGRFPLKQMADWGWINLPESPDSIRPEEILPTFLAAAGSLRPQAILCRSSSHVRSARTMDDYAFTAWVARVLSLATKSPIAATYKPGLLTRELLQEVARLSKSDNGPIDARELLREYGIQVIVERHLSHTYLDGAAIMVDRLKPVIGLTLRYDRIDSFWFTLMHELAHVALHLENEDDVYYDDLDVEAEDDPREREANQFAGEALIPFDIWEKSVARHLRSPQAAELLANQLGIHPAIVAGRMQHEFKAYQLLRNLVGNRQVRRLFPEVSWR